MRTDGWTGSRSMNSVKRFSRKSMCSLRRGSPRFERSWIHALSLAIRPLSELWQRPTKELRMHRMKITMCNMDIFRQPAKVSAFANDWHAERCFPRGTKSVQRGPNPLPHRQRRQEQLMSFTTVSYRLGLRFLIQLIVLRHV